ncbi:hypothetical protein [Nocardia bovistercoris]|uniref:Uncharacterized protein n=1 Tax=Nocardia bovistercoris TaxID=2785916 RepID=A0A931N4K7_9NOCA|nr:hypothetical protein [Nocardia bovistercoris]MBH0778807.1 hypothetical protein [Nocardia bovistercoris]
MSAYNGFSGEYRNQVQARLEDKWSSGEWPRPAECTVCGQAEGAIHGHLEDYSRPETYVPLCITCHLILHMRYREPSMWEAYTRWIRDGYRPDPQTQKAGFMAVKTRFSGCSPSVWPGEPVNPRRFATYLDGLAPVKFIHPNAATAALF